MADEIKNEEVKASTMRQLIIETDGTKITILKNEMSGLLELKAVLTEILTQLR